jgi:WD40 repeat protein
MSCRSAVRDARRQVACRIILTLAICLTAGAALAQGHGQPTPPPPTLQPASDPAADQTLYPRVETGLHEADINRLILLPMPASAIPGSANPASPTIVTVSDDKSARLWSADDFAARGIVRPPIGDRDIGQVYAVAATGSLLAIAGRIADEHGGYAIQFYSLPSLKPRGAITGMPRPTLAMGFSPAGDTLAAGMMDGAGVWMFDMRTLTKLPSDLPYVGDVATLAFAPDGQLAVVGKDDGIRLYGADHHRIDRQTPAGVSAFGVAFSPDGKTLAVGDRVRAVVHLFAVPTNAPLRKLRDLPGAAGRLGTLDVVAFMPDGRTIVAAGSYKDLHGQRLIRRWSLDGRTSSEIPAATDTITDLLPHGEDVLFTSAEPSLGRIDGAGRLARKLRSNHPDFRDAGDQSFRLSAGAVIELPIGQPQLAAVPAANTATMVFDIRAHAPIAPADAPPLALARSTGAGLAVTGWRNSDAPFLNGRRIPLEPNETSHAIAVTQAGSAVAMGTDFYVRYLIASGEVWRTVTAAPAWAVNVSEDGRVVVAGLGDGTVHWYDAKDGHELLALFVDPPTGRFVTWTPDGFFDHDHRVDGLPDGRSLIGYQYNQPDHRSSAFVAIGQMYARFFRPDLVGLAFRDDPVAVVALTDQRERIGSVAHTLSQGLPAEIALLDSCGRAAADKVSGCPATRSFDAASAHGGGGLTTLADSVLVQYKLTSADGKLGTVVVRRNGAVIRPATFVDDEDAHSRTEEAVIPLGDGANAIRIVPVAAGGGVESPDAAVVSLDVTRSIAPAPQPMASTQPAPPARPHTTLYLLSIGVSHYSHAELNLANADNDASAVLKLMQNADPPVYDLPVTRQLIDTDATSANIMAALSDIAAKATPDDLVMIFLAGHGQAVDGKYYFAPVDIGTRDPDLFQRAIDPSQQAQQTAHQSARDQAVNQLFRQEGISQDQLLAVVQTIKANRVALILDTCYSASIATADATFRQDLNSTVANAVGQATGRFVLSSATTLALDSARDTSLPADGQGHGLFTSYLLQALGGAADFNHKGTVDTYKLAVFTQDGVKQATATMNQTQVPEYYFQGNLFFALRTSG